jgi:lipoate---protein ligase
MLLINNPNTDVFFNLASEEYLVKHYHEDVFMLWQNDYSVIVGKHQDVKTEVNLDFVNEKHIKVARRFSGGGTVYNDLGNLNLTFIERTTQPNFDKYTRQMIEFLSTVGIDARTDDRRGLFVNGLKISGSAQYIYKDKVLYHASLLFSSNLHYLNATIDSPYFYDENREKTKPWSQIKSVKSPVANLKDFLPHILTIKEFKNQIINFFINKNDEVKSSVFDRSDLVTINRLKNEKYATRKWNYLAEFDRKNSNNKNHKINVNI